MGRRARGVAVGGRSSAEAAKRRSLGLSHGSKVVSRTTVCEPLREGRRFSRHGSGLVRRFGACVGGLMAGLEVVVFLTVLRFSCGGRYDCLSLGDAQAKDVVE